MLAFPKNGVDVWYTLAANKLDPDQATRYLAVLTPEERARHQRFAQEKDRRQYLLGKVLVRCVLSRYFPLEPQAWLFTTNSFGKPTLANAPSGFTAHFNLSHTDGLVACAIARDFEVGIDVEHISRSANMDVARRFFAPAEIDHLEKLPSARRSAAFLLFWTLKESYVKARGIGLSLPLEQFAFCLEDLAEPQIRFDPAMHEDAAQWRFFLPDVSVSTHQVAVAVKCGKQRDLLVQVRELSP